MNFSVKKFKWSASNIISIGIILLLIIPQTRKPIQIQVQKLMAQFSPSIQYKSDRQVVTTNWQLADLNNKPYNLSETTYKTKIISFWATWCLPCIAEMPSLQALYNDYGDKVDFVFISNEKPNKVNSFLTENEYTFPVYHPIETVNEIYFNPRTLPRTLLIDKNNVIISIEDGASNWNSDKIRQTLNKLINNQVVD
jgi:thiol-disulfide isomerase/thioredoxin